MPSLRLRTCGDGSSARCSLLILREGRFAKRVPLVDVRPGTLRTLKRPRIYGSETRCRTAVARYVEGAEELLDRAAATVIGVRPNVVSAEVAALLRAHLPERRPDAAALRRWIEVGRIPED
jgi:hypothetical protein